MPTAGPDHESLGWERVDAHLQALLELEPDARREHLLSLSDAEPALARRLERLLEASARVAPLDSNELLCEAAHATFAQLARRRVGERFGEWELLQLLGSGGMADVYLAQRAIADGVQQAAVKLVHAPGAGWSTESLVREARVLARLSDPHIARLLDFGRTGAGEPWIAMEYVDGVPIDRWCAQRDASVRERVRLVVHVATALDHAHRSLVVHRDIKPGNVFVSLHDGTVKLLDFGIARSLPADGVDPTRTAQRAYTEAYASPEQLAGGSVAVASDIYQLGELLYLLLAGEHAFANRSSNPAVRLQAMEAGPEPPRRRAAARGERRLAREGATDLDTIALKAMEFRPERRYLSARDFADDLRRWLDGAAISARRGRLYRAGRLLGRHRALAASLVLAATLLGGYIANLLDRKALLEAQRQRTERILDVAVDVLNESDPYVAGASRDLADASMRRIGERVRAGSNEDPEFRSRILSLLASIHARRGQNLLGLDLVKEALAVATRHSLDDALVAELALANARALQTLSRYDEALAVLATHAEDLRRHAYVPSETVHARIETLKGRADAAAARLEAVAAGIPPHDVPTPDERALWNQIAIVRGERGDEDGSIAAAEAAYSAFEPKNARETASWLTYAMNLAVAYREAGRYREAIALHRRVSEWARGTLGPEHPQLLIVERSHADALLAVARFREARDILQAAAPASTHLQLPLHRVRYLRTRAIAALHSGDAAAAFDDFVEADAIALADLGDVPGERVPVLEGLGWTLVELGAYAEAAEVARSIPPGTRPSPRVALLRATLAVLVPAGQDGGMTPVDRDFVSSDDCVARALDALARRVHRVTGVARIELGAHCEAETGSFAAALGANWSPAWAADFPLQPIPSALATRLLARDSAARALPDAQVAGWSRWRRIAAHATPRPTGGR